MNKTSIDNEIYDDPNIMLNSRVPRRSVKQKWTYLRSDYYVHRAGSTGADPFRLYLEEIRQIMGTTEDIQVSYRSRLFQLSVQLSTTSRKIAKFWFSKG